MGVTSHTQYLPLAIQPHLLRLHVMASLNTTESVKLVEASADRVLTRRGSPLPEDPTTHDDVYAAAPLTHSMLLHTQ